MKTRAIAAVSLMLLSTVWADEVTLADGRKLVGKITQQDDATITVLTYKDGPITASAADVKALKKGPSLYDTYEKKKPEFEETADGHTKLGEWCKGQGLTWQARIEWKRAVEIDPDFEAARKALGDRKTKAGWETFEDQQKAKGLEFFEGYWLKKSDIAKIHDARHPSVGWVLTATYTGDADEAFLKSWGERAKDASTYMWELTEGQMYVKELTITDKGGGADFTIVNKDKMKIRDGAYAETGGGTITAPGLILTYTFFHELIHLKYSGEHCDNCKHCIMSSDPKATQVCDDADHKAPPKPSCWGQMRARHKELALKPLTRKWKPTPAPETKVIVKDRQ